MAVPWRKLTAGIPHGLICPVPGGTLRGLLQLTRSVHNMGAIKSLFVDFIIPFLVEACMLGQLFPLVLNAVPMEGVLLLLFFF